MPYLARSTRQTRQPWRVCVTASSLELSLFALQLALFRPALDTWSTSKKLLLVSSHTTQLREFRVVLSSSNLPRLSSVFVAWLILVIQGRRFCI
jgi:hypothetical protein